MARQLLLESDDLSVPAALEQVAGLQTQYSPSGYVGLWSRLRHFRRESLTEGLENRAVVQATIMRATIHMVSAADYRLMAEATRPARASWWLRTTRMELDGIDMDAVAASVRVILADGPLRAAEVQARLAAQGFPRIAWVGAAQWVDMVRVPPSGTWRRRSADLYALADDWLGAERAAAPAAPQAAASDGPAADGAAVTAPTAASAPAAVSAPVAVTAPATATPEAGMELLVRRYLGGFGPAPLPAIANWAGILGATLRPVIERLDLRRFRDERGAELFDVRDGPLPEAATPVPVRFLPTWDATLLAHARRAGIVPDDRRPLIFNTRTPHSVPTFLVDGIVAGTWRYEGGRVTLSPFEALPGRIMGDLESEAERLAAFHAD